MEDEKPTDLLAEFQRLSPDQRQKKIDELLNEANAKRDINERLLAQNGPTEPMSSGVRMVFLYQCWQLLYGVTGFVQSGAPELDAEKPVLLRRIMEDLYYAAAAETARECFTRRQSETLRDRPEGD